MTCSGNGIGAGVIKAANQPGLSLREGFRGLCRAWPESDAGHHPGDPVEDTTKGGCDLPEDGAVRAG